MGPQVEYDLFVVIQKFRGKCHNRTVCDRRRSRSVSAQRPPSHPPIKVTDVNPDDLLAGLDDQQSAAVTSAAAPLCILAGAGSGKTRVITRRIAHRAAMGSLEPKHTLAVTFTRKAASELSDRLSRLGLRDRPAAGTFHSLAYGMLRQRWADNGRTPPELLDRKSRILVPMVNSKRSLGVQAIDIATEIEWAKARMIMPEEYGLAVKEASRRTPTKPSIVAKLYAEYEDVKRKKRYVDFDDLLGLCADAMERDLEFGRAMQWRYRHFFVDEFQDVNPLQHRLLESWRGLRPDLCVVGDPNQAIYAWNGADSDFLTRFDRYYPGGETVTLVDNYRSAPQILAVANAVLASSASPGTEARLRPHADPGPVPTVRSMAKDRDEATGIAQSIRRHHDRGTRFSDMAVLTRTNAQLTLITDALNKLAIPFRTRGNANLLEQPEIRQALVTLRQSPPAMAFESALSDLVEPEFLDTLTDDRRANIEALVRLGHDYAMIDGRANAEGFAAWLAASQRSGDASGNAGVDLATFHAAKGLEWQIVFLAGIEQGYVPMGQANTPEQREEELRLLYVAVTRAERELHVSWATERTFGERTATRQPSPWIGAIELAIESMRKGAEPADWRKALASIRTVSSAGSGAGAGKPRARMAAASSDDPLLGALKTWRASIAKAAKVPAYVIFNDATLNEIAVVKPRNEGALLTVSGVGPVKASRWGETVIDIVAEYV